MTRLTFSILVIVSIFSCKQSLQLTEDERRSISDSIRVTLKNYNRDVKALGLTAEFKYLDKSSDFFWVPPGYSSAIPYDSVRSILIHRAPQFKSVNNVFETLKIIPLNKEIGTYTGRLSSIITDTTGKISKFSLIETGIVIKRKDGWKLLSGQTSILP